MGVSLASDLDAVESVAVTRDGEVLRCDLLASRPTPETVLADHGGRVLDATVEHGRASITAVSQRESDVGSLVEGVRSVYPEAGVRSVRSTGPTARGTAPDELLESLTDRQRRAIEVAYHAGYFERPREHNTTEVAEKLGVSRQTFTQHLRAGQRKVLDGVLDRPSE